MSYETYQIIALVLLLIIAVRCGARVTTQTLDTEEIAEAVADGIERAREREERAIERAAYEP